METTKFAKLYTYNKIALIALEKHGLKDWTFKFDSAVRRFGCCYHNRKLITISKKLTLCNEYEQFRNTLLHEIAHALAGRHNGHNNVWRKIALEIGCNGERCYGNEVTRPEKKWLLECKNCKRTTTKHRKSITLACGKCCKELNENRWSEKYLFIWIQNPKYNA